MKVAALGTSWHHVYHANLMNAMLAPDGELINHTFELEPNSADVRVVDSEARGFRLEFSEAMAQWTLRGSVAPTAEMLAMNPNAAKFGTVFDDGAGGLCTAYGPRILEQLPYVLAELRRDPSSRRACIMMLGADDRFVAKALGESRTNCEYLCTYGFNFRLRSGALDLAVSMRSNNYTTTVCQDVYVFSRLQEEVARQLGVPIGRYYHSTVSGHVLPHERERAAQILQEYAHNDGRSRYVYSDWKGAIGRLQDMGEWP